MVLFIMAGFCSGDVVAQYTPQADIRGSNDTDNGAKLQLATPSESHFFRLFSGDGQDPKPYLLFSDASNFRIASAKVDFSDFRDLVTISGSGQVGLGTNNPRSLLHLEGDITTRFDFTWRHYVDGWLPSYQNLPWLRKAWSGTLWDHLYIGAAGNRDNSLQAAILLTHRQGILFGKGHNNADQLSEQHVQIDTSGNLLVSGAVQIGNSIGPGPETGTIRWTGADFEGWNGIIWVSLTGNVTVGSVTDIDGNTYQTIRIGTQEWMVENLRTSRYRDGTVIPQLSENVDWALDFDGAWCWYGNDNTNEQPYGKLYNWYAVNNGNGLCPTNWHVPSDPEWSTLTSYLGGSSVAGGKMKESGTTHWLAPNTGASNESGFTGLPGGQRSASGIFSNIGTRGNWWSSTEFIGDPFYLYLRNISDATGKDNGLKHSGFSVRCVKD